MSEHELVRSDGDEEVGNRRLTDARAVHQDLGPRARVDADADAWRLDVMVEPQVNPWDVGPLLVIVEEAGGRLTDFDGTPTIYGGCGITTNGRLHASVLALFGGKAAKHAG